MKRSFEEKILDGVIQEIEAIIAEVKEAEGQANNTSPIDILIKVNKKVEEWYDESSELLNLDSDKIEKAIERAKETITLEAKNKVASDIAEIVTDGKGNVTKRISDYTKELKKQGIDFNLEGEEEKKESSRNVSKERRIAMLHSSLNRPLDTPAKKERSYTSYRSYESECHDYGCGGGSGGCGGGGC